MPTEKLRLFYSGMKDSTLFDCLRYNWRKRLNVKEMVMDSNKKVEVFPPGTILVKESDLTRKMYIIKTGKVKVYKNYFDKKITLAILGPGEIFGELSLFDAAPRSASVETITEVTDNVIEGENALAQIENLPNWVIKVLRTTFYRFREMDQKLTTLQSLTDFQKKTGMVETVAETIYAELIRFNKILELLYNGKKEQGLEHVEYKIFQKEMDDMLGQKFIGHLVYFKVLLEQNFISLSEVNGIKMLTVDSKQFVDFNQYLANEITLNRYLLLNINSISILRKLVGLAPQDIKNKEEETRFNKEQNKLQKTPEFEKCLDELVKKKILADDREDIVANVEVIHKHYVYQSIIKNFDHTIIHV